MQGPNAMGLYQGRGGPYTGRRGLYVGPRYHSSGFNFASLPGLVGNWDASVASSLTKTDDNIDTIADQSGAGNDVSYVSGERVTDLGSINSITAATMAGGNKIHNGPTITMPTEGAIICAAELTTIAGGPAVGGAGLGGNGPGFFFDIDGSGKLRTYLGTGSSFDQNSTALTITASTPFVGAMRWDATNVVRWLNLSKDTRAHGLTFAGGTITIVLFTGNSIFGNGGWGPGNWGQLVMYNQGQTDADMELAIAAMAAKWGITV